MPDPEQASPSVSPGETTVLRTASAAEQAREASTTPYEAGTARSAPRTDQASARTSAQAALGNRGPTEPDAWLADTAGELPGRPRLRLLAPVPLALLSILLVACGFIAGVLVEKHQTTSTGGASALSSSGGLPTGSGSAASRFRELLGGTRGAVPGSRSGAAGALAGAGVTTGEVAYVRNGTLYVKNSEGNTVRVKAAPGSSVTKTVTTKVDSIHPGETVVVRGSRGSGGAIQASSITVGSSGGAGLFGSAFAGRGGTGSTSTGGAKSAPGASEQPLFGP